MTILKQELDANLIKNTLINLYSTILLIEAFTAAELGTVANCVAPPNTPVLVAVGASSAGAYRIFVCLFVNTK